MALPILGGKMLPTRFRDVDFHVELGARSGGRRVAPHEFPKRDDPYPEDMGRKGRGFTITGYLIGPAWRERRDALIAALEKEGPGQLSHPTLGLFYVQPGIYSAVERRERGGYAEIEMNFFEAGELPNFATIDDTRSLVRKGADDARNALIESGNAELKKLRV